MTIELSPEVEADIRELLRLWGWDANDHALVDATALGCLISGVQASLGITREAAELRDAVRDGRERLSKVARKWDLPQSVPDARVFEEPLNVHDPYWRDQAPLIPGYTVNDPPLRFVQTPTDIAEGTEVRTSGGRLLVWRGGAWRDNGRCTTGEEGGAS